MIKSIEYDQSIILKNILSLNKMDRFDADLSYGNGGFYKEIPKPLWRFDIDDNLDETITCSSSETPLDNESISSCVFDPPFLTYIKAAREHNSVMAKRFGGYWAYQELEDHYKSTINEAHRILKKKGLMVFKCQDIIHNHKMHPTHINVVNWANGLFRLKDMFILAAKNRMPMNNQEGVAKRVQKHARIYHSYFLVLEKTLNDSSKDA